MKTQFETIVEFEELKTKIRRIGETLIEMLDEDYDHEDIESYIRQHLIVALTKK